MRQVKTTILNSMKEILEEDERYFKIKLGTIGNALISYYSNKNIEKYSLKSGGNEKFKFNLNKENDEMYEKILEENKIENEAEYLRNIIFTYINNPKYKREEILFYPIFKEIRKMIDEKKKINIKYNNSIRTVNPYFLKVSDNGSRTYLFCYCEKNNDYRSYKVSEIESIKVSKNDCEIKDFKYIKEIERNFDPFLSYKKEVKVRFTEKGEELFNRVHLNRPKVKEINKDREYLFECDEKLAQVYFPQFFSEVEILEPVSLRAWFKDKFFESYRVYEK